MESNLIIIPKCSMAGLFLCSWFCALSIMNSSNNGIGLASANWLYNDDKIENDNDEEKTAVLLDHPRNTSIQYNNLGQIAYGVDTSFPMHGLSLSDNYDTLSHNIDPNLAIPAKYSHKSIQRLGDKNDFYNKFMKGCRDKYTKGRKGICDYTEEDRVAMTRRQPSGMINYTDTGFKKIRAPEKAFKLIKTFWDNNRQKASLEGWSKGNTYINQWETHTTFVSIENGQLRGGGSEIKQKVWDATRDTLQQWTGEELTPCSLYGIRVYHENAVLAPHVDRMPLITSAIINVDSDLDEPWPLEVIGRDGLAYNITMSPGDMVLYESHSTIHGRPFPLKGRFVANIFVHFEPTGHTLRHHGPEADADAEKHRDGDEHERYRKAADKKIGGHENDAHENGLPVYIKSDSVESDRWFKSHPNGRKKKKAPRQTGTNEAHKAAMDGNYSSLKTIAKLHPEKLTEKDSNGWRPIHEASRKGSLESLKILVEAGVGINEVTNGSSGETPLDLAIADHGEESDVVMYLLSMGGLESGPDL